MRQEREASWEEGREEGIEEGIKKGKQELLERLIQKKLVKGKSISEIAEELGRRGRGHCRDDTKNLFGRENDYTSDLSFVWIQRVM